MTPTFADAPQPAGNEPGRAAEPGPGPAPETAVLAVPSTQDAAILIAYGRVSWPQVARILAGSEAAWADYDGFHIGAPPTSPPPYTHLWAWTTDWLARIRIDGQNAIAGVLSLRAQPANPPPEQWRQNVTFRHARSQTWLPTEKRVGPLRPEITGKTADLYLVTGEHPVTFVRVQPKPGR